jgi:hypothetical protein
LRILLALGIGEHGAAGQTTQNEHGQSERMTGGKE